MNSEGEVKKGMLKKMMDIPQNPKEENTFPALDYIFEMQLETKNLLDRVRTLKIDPTTNMMYDPVINVASEIDKKLIGRLEPLKYDEERLIDEHNKHMEEIEALAEDSNVFHHMGLEHKVFNRLDAALKTEAAEAIVKEKLQELLKLKYSWFESDIIPETLKEILPSETSAVPDVSEPNESHAGNRERDRGLLNPSSMRKSDSKLFMDRQRRPSNAGVSNTGSKRMLPGISGGNLSTYSGEQLNFRGRQKLEDSFSSIYGQYVEDLEKVIKYLKDKFAYHRVLLSKSQELLVIALREKEGFNTPLKAFAENYMRFVMENPEVIKLETCKKKLFQRVDVLHDEQWKKIQETQETAMAEKKRLLSKNMIQKDVQSMANSFLKVVANEINRLFNLK